ncbi:MAG: amino acid ABC transporter permease, partial [Chloroflexi bacterium]|nr:amino acid ABC transporter permease [Chloroflexota bacterium]
MLVQTFFNPPELGKVFPLLFAIGLRNTLAIAAAAIALALVVGMCLALLIVSRSPVVRAPARVYVDVFRGLPAILTVLMIGTGLPIAGVRPFGRNTFAYAILALAIVNAAYICEIFRSGIQSVEKGQMEAARGLGLSYLQAMRLVVIPQGVRRVLPALTNQFIVCIKESSFVYLLGLSTDQRELFTIGQDQDATTGGLTGLVAAGLMYLIITVPLTYAVNAL